MKTLLILPIIFTILTIPVFSQSNVEIGLLNKKDIDKKIIDDIIWVRDSIHYLEGIDTEWKLTKRQIVLSRDNLGRILSAIEKVSDSNNKWVNSTLTKVKYHNNKILQDSLVLAWNIGLNQWKDTLYYLKKDYRGNILESK